MTTPTMMLILSDSLKPPPPLSSIAEGDTVVSDDIKVDEIEEVTEDNALNEVALEESALRRNVSSELPRMPKFLWR